MSSVATALDWNEITNRHGVETRLAIENLLSEYDVPADGTVALLIASMFISQKDSVVAFDEVSKIFETGQSDLSDQFKGLVEQLRGIISFAQEHLVETTVEKVSSSQSEIVENVRKGVAKAISKANASQERRTIVTTLFTMGAAGILAISGAAVGSIVTASVTSKPAPAEQTHSIVNETIKNADTWKQIIELNQETVQNCISQSVQLENRCVIDIPE
ncbi:MAG: hypothetical protein WBB01_23810 [Phormidesmis sp.]